ncbi:dual specificity phosphatase [Pyrenophora seminiperda CCB06]|uniref:protein-tyrosine-phosphatase n=1 Tax=Pyrenophora seminiperda CCB06 TaxID=1302712 RepID=A0A3M7M1Y6_9PLEO|nr:dual specificity phosphatase [Pyrenophora seminiperda CCB06]
MSYLLHGRTSHNAMGWLDVVPRTHNRLYIGGLYALYHTDLVQAAGITHVLSVINYEVMGPEAAGGEKLEGLGLKHFHIRAEDDPNENLLQYFDAGVRFIHDALSAPTPSTSSSSTPSTTNNPRNPQSSYTVQWQLCEGRPICEPNVGFREQLEVWGRMCGVEGEEGEKRRVYEEWVEGKFVGEVWEWERRGKDRSAKL